MHKNKSHFWIFWAIISFLIVFIVFKLTYIRSNQNTSAGLNISSYDFSQSHAHLDHKKFFKDSLYTPQEITLACLNCHKNSAHEVMQSNHWKWESPPTLVPWKKDPVITGKKQGYNNFCISISGGNWPKCTSCHVGYGWENQSFDFRDSSRIDCLVCHDQSGQYLKGTAGWPQQGVDLKLAAQSVGRPTRNNCGSCHFSGGGGNAVKHGDLDESLYQPSEELDVHMGKHNLNCVDCHKTKDHRISGRSISVSPDTIGRIDCNDCHQNHIHKDQRIQTHTARVACQTCHIPEVAKKTATKTEWDWSKAGQEIPEDKHHYLKIKGEFKYTQNLKPEYHWYNGWTKIYQSGDSISRGEWTDINTPQGSIKDSTAKIWPFKIHEGKQIYDLEFKNLIPPNTAADSGYWKIFDWEIAARTGAEYAGLKYSGKYGFTKTRMYWHLNHMVSPKEKALTCLECHGDQGRMPWKQLGYEADPMFFLNKSAEK